MTDERPHTRRVSVTQAALTLSRLIDDVQEPGVTVEITRGGNVAAVLVGHDTLDSMTETMFWMSQEGVGEDVAAARRDLLGGVTAGGDVVRSRFGLPPVRPA